MVSLPAILDLPLDLLPEMQVEAYAKVNFTLEVFPLRGDGYHALRSLVVPVSLSDTLEITATEDRIISSDSPYPDDLALKAAHLFRSHCQSPAMRIKGARIHLVKRIPAGAGLGGGSADAAATLLALNDLWKVRLTRESLAEIAGGVGSDVPSLVLGGPVVMEGRGEKVHKARDLQPVWLVIASRGVFSSTKEVYKNANSRVTDDPEILYNMLASLKKGDLQGVAAAFINDLAQSACALHPEIAQTMADMRAAGAIGVQMSGSGSSVVGLVRDPAHGREISARMEAKGCKTWCVQTIVQ